MAETFEIKVTLRGSAPLIWRRIQVCSKYSFFELHHILQICMGWKNYHMYEFNIEGYCIGEATESAKAGYEDSQQMESSEVMLADLIEKAGDQFVYLYDYGDYWQHDVTVEKVITNMPITHAICLDGKMSCPPEDVGGIGSYIADLKVLEDKKHPEYKGTKTWFGRNFDAEKFEIEKVNKKLRRLNKYIRKWQNGDLY